MKNNNDIILDVRNLKQYFYVGTGKNKFTVKAVDDVTFQVKKGEVFSLVGESGSGKTTTGRTIIKLYDSTDGEVYFQGVRIGAGTDGLKERIRNIKTEAKTQISELKQNSSENPELQDQINQIKSDTKNQVKELKSEIKLRNKDAKKNHYELMKNMQMIFQDPVASLNPRMTVKEIIAEGLRISGLRNEKELNERVHKVLEIVGLMPDHANRYPHEFSGGQRQRIGIARSIIVNPDLIIADEPVSALDVSIQAQVINLLNDLRNELGLTILFIAHDLSVVKYFSDRIAVMFMGKIVELADKEELFRNPMHPYTQSLLSSIPIPDPRSERSKSKSVRYDPKVHDYSINQPKLQELKTGHFIYANDTEMVEYKKRLK